MSVVRGEIDIMDAAKRHRIETLIKRLRSLEVDASETNLTHMAYSDELAGRRIKLEKMLLDEDIDEFYRAEDRENVS